MPDERGTDPTTAPEPALGAPLLQRTRLLLWLMLGTGVAFTALEVATAPELGPHTVVKCFGLSSMTAFLLCLGRPWGEAHAAQLSLALVGGGYVFTALSGALSPSHEYATSATLFVAASLMTATLLPWGARLQAASVGVAATTLALSIWHADGSFAILATDPAAAVLVGFVASVVVAAEMQRSRRDTMRHYRSRRAAEAETRALNADLERRVVERTAALEQANERLESEVFERQRIAEALHESRKRLLDVIDHSTALVSLKDRDGRYLLVNRAFEETAGRPRSQILGSFDDAFLSRRRAAEQRLLDLRVLAGEMPHSFEEKLATSDGARSYFSVKFPLRRPSGAVYGIGTISTDITRLRRAEDDARQRQDDLAHVQRLHLVNQMAATLAHEIHQPLCAIANYAQGARQRARSDELSAAELMPILERIAAEALRAGEILRGVRRMVDRRRAAHEPVELGGAITEALGAVELHARRHGVDIQHAPCAAPAIVLADKTQIEQVVVNLALNGIDAAADDARASLRRVSIASRLLPRQVEVTVSDSGRGVGPVDAGRLFTPFFSTKATGLGMGLAISRSIVEAHGGDLRLIPSAGGAAFRFTLPLAEQGPPPATPE